METMTLGALASYLSGELQGDPAIEIVGINSIQQARPGEITFVAHKRYLKDLERSQASAVLVAREMKVTKPAILIDHPYLAFARVLELYHPPQRVPAGVDARAVIGEHVRLGREVRIYPQVCIGNDVDIGDRVCLYPGVYLGDDTTIGDDTVIHANVSIYGRVRIGSRVIIHSGVVIGSDGFGFVRDGERHRKILHIGRVIIEDEVEIGANVCIDRGNLGDTVVGRGCKFDNLVHVAHNVSIGADALLVAQVGISGSCEVEKGVTLAGQVGVADHVKIGQGATVIAQSGVARDVPPHAVLAGSPALPHREWRRVQMSLPKLPELLRVVQRLQRRLQALEDRLQL